MAKQFMALCALGSLWVYLPPAHGCKQHKPADAKTIEGRRKWIAKAEAGSGGAPC